MKQFLSDFCDNYKKVWSQFLPSAVISVSFAVFGIMMAWMEAYDDAWIVNLLLVLVISFFLFLVWSSYVQSNHKKLIVNGIGGLVLVVLLCAYYFYLPKNLDDFESIYLIRHVLITLASVGLVFVSHYQLKSSTQKFWNFSRATAEAIIQAVFFSAILFIGLSLTFASIDFLFEINMPDEIYPSTWFAVVGGFATFYFLSKLPVLNAEPEDAFNCNKLWKFLGAYILFPLLALYFLVLYSYTAKVLLTWEWPSGQISYMIAAFSLVGTITYWILTPHVEGGSKAWSRYTVGFWGLLLLQVAVLFTAIGLRINQYGITPNRYLIVLFGVYLTILCLYFLFSKVRDRRIIPLLFSGLILITSTGPWGLFEVSKASQTKIINNIFETHGLLQSETITKPEKEIPKDERRQLSSALDFLVRTFGKEQLEPWSGGEKVDSVTELLKMYDIEYVSRWDIDYEDREVERMKYFYLNLENTLEPVSNTQGAQVLMFRKLYDKEELGTIEGTTVSLKKEGLLELVSASGETTVSLQDWLKERKRADHSRENLTFESEQVTILFTNVDFRIEDQDIELNHASGVMILK